MCISVYIYIFVHCIDVVWFVFLTRHGVMELSRDAQ